MTKEELIKTLEEYDKEVNRLFKENKKLKSIFKEIRKYCNDNINSDSSIILTTGKITDIGYCIPAFEDILGILDKENK